MNEYKFTKQIQDYGKYVQYPDLYANYKKQEEASYIEVGITRENDYKIVPGINVICGMTGHGKSMLANSIAYRALQKNLNVLYITLEISKEDVFYQMLSIKSFLENYSGEKLISHSTLKNRNLTSEQEHFVFDELWPAFKNSPGNLHVLSEWDFDTTSTAGLQIKLQEIEDYSKAQTGRGIDLMIVDYIQLFKEYKESDATGEYSVLNMWVNDFRKLSVNYLGQDKQIPIILLSQLNRDAWADDKTRYKAMAKNSNSYAGQSRVLKKAVRVPEVVMSISQVAGSSEIAKAATQIFSVYTDENLKVSNECLISVLKCRNGETSMEPKLSYMEPKYYYMGSNTDDAPIDIKQEILLEGVTPVDLNMESNPSLIQELLSISNVDINNSFEINNSES